MTSIYPKASNATSLTFAQQAAAAAFGRNYVRPRDRAFVDHEPWQKLGGISDDVVDRLRRDRSARARERVEVPA